MLETILWIAAMLLAALVLFFLEICTPSFGLLAAAGIASLIGAAVLAFRLNSLAGICLVVAYFALIPLYLTLMVKLLPKTPLGKRMLLRKARDASGEGTPEADELAELIGQTGTTETKLRPSGAIRIAGKRVVALAETGMIAKGATVKVIRANGTDVIVRLAE